MPNNHQSTTCVQPNIEKQIKRHIYGKPQSVLVVFPAGLASAALAEAQSILDHLWFQNKFPSDITVIKNTLRIDHIHMSAIMELLLRGQCFTDIRLIISEGKMVNIPAFSKKCEAIDWDFYLAPKMLLKLKVDVGGSPSLHEGAMKDILARKLEEKIKAVVTGEEVQETSTVYLDVYQYHHTMSLSLAGAALYKRGYRSAVSHSAPLREDIAACCIRNALQFGGDTHDYAVFIPFSGTGTFLFEYWMMRYQFAPVLFGRKYALQMMPLFRSETFQYLLKKAREHCLIETLKPHHFYCVDQAREANAAMQKNIENFKQAVTANDFAGHGEVIIAEDNVITMDIATKLHDVPGDLFIPINPPYGIRLGSGQQTVALYKKIAQQLNELAAARKPHQILGFILCPSEESWSMFCKTFINAKIDTYHLTQGGLDIRVAQFMVMGS